MREDENEAESLVHYFLSRHGFEVERLAANHMEKRADYLARYGSETYVIEVKGRPGDDTYRRELFSRGYAESQSPLGRTNTVSGIIRRAAGQLASTESGGNPFRVLALVAEGEDLDTQLTQLKYSLYGIVDICVPGRSTPAEAIPCFYFTHSDFVRFPQLDACILFAADASLLCLNELSHRIDSLRSSELHELYRSRGAVVDPPEQEREGRAFIAGEEADRTCEEATVRFIREKYGLTAAIAVAPNRLRVGVFP